MQADVYIRNENTIECFSFWGTEIKAWTTRKKTPKTNHSRIANVSLKFHKNSKFWIYFILLTGSLSVIKADQIILKVEKFRLAS